jgi:uncharacterized protein (DUF2267 family)
VKTASRPILHLKRGSAPRNTFYLKRRFRKSNRLQTDEFIRRVQAHAPDHDPSTAQTATYATLEVLGQYLTPHQARRLTAQLPRELAEAAQRSVGRGGPADLRLFYAQIANKTNLPPEIATDYARAVTSALRQTVSEGNLADAMLNLPRSLDDLVA